MADSAKRKKRSFGYKIKKFGDVYKSTDEYLGEGSCGTVRTYFNVEKQKEFAVKIIENTSKRVRKKVLKEIEILHHCKGHPNITQLQEFYEEDQKFYLVFEKMEGLTLLDWMERHGGSMGEEEVSKVANELANALNFLHHKGVAHRDLKLENVLCTSIDQIHPVKICDFDLSTDFGGGFDDPASGSPGYGSGSEKVVPMEHFNLNNLASAVGSADYMAPEVVRVWLNEDCHYSELCDIWSLGVILYILLSGYKPFGGKRSDLCCCPSNTILQCSFCKEEHFEEIKEGVVDMEDEVWQGVSEGAKDLLSRLLVKDPAHRLTAMQVLHHAWVQDASVFVHTRSLPIPCLPQHKDRSRWSNDSQLEEGTLVHESFNKNLRIFSLELDDQHMGKHANQLDCADEVLEADGTIERLKEVKISESGQTPKDFCGSFGGTPTTLNWHLFGSCDSGNHSGISLVGSPCHNVVKDDEVQEAFEVRSPGNKACKQHKKAAKQHKNRKNYNGDHYNIFERNKNKNKIHKINNTKYHCKVRNV